MKTYIERKERYNHRTTPEVLWCVRCADTDRLIQECKTRKEARVWQDIYTDKEQSCKP